jgi:2-methylisocitrate lyase-like PEP mutase family enzyme
VRTTQAATRFRALHEGFFVMPNPFDAGTARLLADFGFPAIATSSAALAWSRARPDGGIDSATAIAHAADLAAATGLPVNGDFESGYGVTPAEVADTVTAAIDAGVAGCSVEDLATDRPEPLHETAMACRRLEAARDAVERSGGDFVLTGRCEALLAGGDPDPFATVLSRLKAYEAAGAHVVYAPGLTEHEQVCALVQSVSVPVNVLAGLGGVSDDIETLRRLGVTRVSLGSGLAKVALGAFRRAAEALAAGRVELADPLASATLNALMSPQDGETS